VPALSLSCIPAFNCPQCQKSACYFKIKFIYIQQAEICGCPLPGSVQGQVRWGSEQPGLVSLPMIGGGGTKWSLRSLPTQTILWFYMIP